MSAAVQPSVAGADVDAAHNRHAGTLGYLAGVDVAKQCPLKGRVAQ